MPRLNHLTPNKKNQPLMRIPRTLNTTNLSIELKDTHNKELLYQHIVRQYSLNNFQYLGQYISIEQLGDLLNIDTHTINQTFLSLRVSQIGLTSPETANELIRALNAELLNGVLADRRAALQQLSMLQSSQGAGYKAFVTSEVNKALKLSMEATTNIASALSALKPSGPSNNTQINIFESPEQGPDATQQSKALTADDAIRLIDSKGINDLRTNTDAQQSLFETYGINDTPEVNALRQLGNSEDSVPNLQIDEFVEDIEYEDHTNRREAELEIDPLDDSI